jgi:tetratricopeptide (TPR) repeat protein
VICGLPLLLPAQAPPVPPAAPLAEKTAEEAVIFDRIENRIHFEDDGTGQRETTAVIRVQSQAGVQETGQLVFGYSSATENFEVKYVRVRKPDGRVIETPASGAQDFAPDVLREAPMYSDYRQRHISVSGLAAGDVLEYCVIVHVSTALAPHEFWYEHVFPRGVVVREDLLQVDIPKWRDVKLKSPKHKYETQESGGRRVYTWEIKDFVPKRKPGREKEDENEFDDQPDVQLSSFTDWLQIAHWYGKLQGERVAVDDAVRKKADELTRGVKTPVEKAHRLYDFVALNIRYVSLSFGVGRYQPHAASEVMANGYGDCKDKHTLLQSLLQAEGIESYPVLIDSSRKIDADVPSPGQFDHVITAAKLGPELTWLDTTAEVTPFGLLLYQLRNKQALLASNDANAGLRRTPADSPVKNRMAVDMEGKFTEVGAFDSTIDLTAQGDSDWPIRSAFRRIPQAQWPRILESFSASWGMAGDVSDIHLEGLENTSKPFHITYHYHEDNFFKVPTSGSDFRILPVMARTRGTARAKTKGAEPLDVGPAGEQIYHARVQFPANYTVHVAPDVQMTRDFGEYSSSYTLNQNTLEAARRMVLKVNELPASRRTDYESFRNATGNEAQQVLWCSITPASGEAVASAAKAGGTPEEMRKAGAAALDRNDFATAANLLKRSIEQDTNQKDAWDDLGCAYAGLNQHDEAILAFRKQIEANPDHPRANGDLANELQQQGKLDDAVAAYRKQIEIDPSSKSAHKSLGLLLVQMKRDSDARTELEAAISIPPEDPEVKMALAQVYTRTGNAEKGEALMKSVTGATTGGAGADLYAAALGDSIDPNQALHDARQTLDQIGDQFDSGEYDHLGPPVFSAMNLVALAWARIGWAKFLQGETLEAMQFLNSSWVLSQSGSVGNRLARVLQKEGQREKARHMYALAAAAGGADAAASRQQTTALAVGAGAADKEIAQARAELQQMLTVKLPALTAANGSAQFGFVFDSSSKPERVEYLQGDVALRGAGSSLREKEFPVKFPDVSSVKIVRRGTLACGNSQCTVVLLPPEPMNPAPPPDSAASGPEHH